MDNIKLCKNCQHFWNGEIGEHFICYPICTRSIPSYVYGTVPLNIPPKIEREKGECGLSGQFFILEEKECRSKRTKYAEPVFGVMGILILVIGLTLLLKEIFS